jgi:hypothetical protein
VLLGLVVVGLACSPMLGVVALGAAQPAQQATAAPNTTATPTAAPVETPAPTSGQDAGNWTLQELRRGGEQPASAPASVRLLDGNAGAVSLRYQPARPLSEGGYQVLGRNQRLETNALQVYSTVFDDTDAEWSLLVVSWQQRQRQVETEAGDVVLVSVRDAP